MFLLKEIINFANINNVDFKRGTIGNLMNIISIQNREKFNDQ